MNSNVYPIIFTTDSYVKKQKTVFVCGMIVGLIFVALGLARLLGILGSDDIQSTPIIIVGLVIALICALLYFKVSNPKTNPYTNTEYRINADAFIIYNGENKPQEVYSFQDYIITTEIITVKGNSNCRVIMENKNGKKTKRPCMLSVPVFREFATALYNATS